MWLPRSCTAKQSGARGRSPERRVRASACKPDSVRAHGVPRALDRHLSARPTRARQTGRLSASPASRAGGSAAWPCTPRGLPSRTGRPRALVGSYPTVSPITCDPGIRRRSVVHRLVCSLLHVAVTGGLPSRASVFTERGAHRCPDFPLQDYAPERRSSRRAGQDTARGLGFVLGHAVHALASRKSGLAEDSRMVLHFPSPARSPKTTRGSPGVLTSRATRVGRGPKPARTQIWKTTKTPRPTRAAAVAITGMRRCINGRDEGSLVVVEKFPRVGKRTECTGKDSKGQLFGTCDAIIATGRTGACPVPPPRRSLFLREVSGVRSLS